MTQLKGPKIVAIILIIFILLSNFNVFAADDIDSSSDTRTNIADAQSGYIDVDLQIGNQIPLLKTIPIKITFTPKISGRKCYIQINHLSGLKTKSDKLWVNFEKDSKTTQTIYIKPTKPGDYNVSISVIVFGYDINYADTQSVQININDSLIMKQGYGTYIISTVFIVLLFVLLAIILGIFMIKLGKIMLKKIKIWILKDPKYQPLGNQQEIEEFYQKLNQKNTPQSNSTKQTNS